MAGIILAITYAAFFIFLIRRLPFFQIDGISRNAISVGFIVKIIFGTLLWAVYSHNTHYQGRADIFFYFDDGKVIYRALYERPLDYIKILLGSDDPSLFYYLKDTGNWSKTYIQGIYNESKTIIRFNAIVDIFSFGNYHVHTVFICFLSLIGLIGILKTFLPYFENKKKELFAIIFFIPSVLFWGSGVLKEGLILFAMGMVIYHWNKFLIEKFSVSRLFLIIIFIGLLSISKAYILLMLLPILISHSWISKTGNRKPALKYLTVFSIFAIIIILQKKIDIPFMLMDKQRQSIYMSSGGSYLGIPDKNKFVYISPKFTNRIIPIKDKLGYCKIAEGVSYASWYFENYIDSTYILHSTDTTTYWIYYDIEPSGSRIDIPLLYPSYSSIIKNAPISFINTAFRPTIIEAKNPMMLMSAIENFFFVIFIIICLCFPIKKINNSHIIYFCASFVILLFVLIGLTTPILGAVVRYKILALPFFFMLFLLILDKEKMLQKLPFLKRFIS
jgi:hypothetical protein